MPIFFEGQVEAWSKDAKIIDPAKVVISRYAPP